jgi:ferredoxin
MSKTDVYRNLQEHIDEYLPMNYPSTETGVEIRLLKHLFTPEEARLTLNLSALPESLELIHKRLKDSGMSIEELEQKLDVLVEKGAIWGGKIIPRKKGEKQYSLAQFALGMFELQVDKITKEFMEDAHEYIEETYYKEWHKTDTPCQMRTIPVDHSITVEHNVSTYDSLRQIIENTEGPISVMNCICRTGMDLLDQPCAQTDIRETCIQIGNYAEFFCERGSGREVTKEEMFEILQKFEDIGLILQPENTQNPGFICACCGDCCISLAQVKRFPRPAEFYETNYNALVNSEECQSCNICMDRCQLQALSIVNNVSTVNLDRCIGCGNCVTTCPSNAIQLQKKEKEKVPPKNFMSLMQKIMMKKKGTWGSLKLIGKKILGMRI